MTIPEFKKMFETLMGLPVSDKKKINTEMSWVLRSFTLIKIPGQTCIRLSSGVRMKSQRYSPFPMEASLLLFSKQVTQKYKNDTRPHFQTRRGAGCWQTMLPSAVSTRPGRYHPSINPKVLREAALQAQCQVGREVLQHVRLSARLVCHLQRTHTPCD